MTVKSDLEKALAAAESAKATYATFALSTEDESAKQMFNQMAQDLENHVSSINSRIQYNSSNTNQNQ